MAGSRVVGAPDQSYNRRVSFGAILPLRGISPESGAAENLIQSAQSLLLEIWKWGFGLYQDRKQSQQEAVIGPQISGDADLSYLLI